MLTGELEYWIANSGVAVARGYADVEAAPGTWDIWQIGSSEITVGVELSPHKMSDVKPVKSVVELEADYKANARMNYVEPSGSGSREITVGAELSPLNSSSSSSDVGTEDWVPDDYYTTAITPSTTTKPKITVIEQPYKPTDAEIDYHRSFNKYWNPKTKEWEEEETGMYKNEVIDTSTTDSTTAGETDYATTADTSEVGFSDYNDPNSMYSAATAPTLDVALDLTELKNVARDFDTTPTGTFNPADLNRDGIVDIFDLVEASKREQARQKTIWESTPGYQGK
jgi:hypothetical protein